MLYSSYLIISDFLQNCCITCQTGKGKATTNEAANIAYLPRCIYNFSRKLLALVFDDFAKGVFNRRIITLHKMAIHKAHS